MVVNARFTREEGSLRAPLTELLRAPPISPLRRHSQPRSLPRTLRRRLRLWVRSTASRWYFCQLLSRASQLSICARSQSQCLSSRSRISSPFSRRRRSRLASAAASSPTSQGSSSGLGVRVPELAVPASSAVVDEDDGNEEAEAEDDDALFSSEAQW